MDAAHRDALAREILRALVAAHPGSQADLRGSLATGHADAFSDIDVRWRVPEKAFKDAVAWVAEVLEKVWPIALVRRDAQWQKSVQRRRVFVAFSDLPLFWGLDLDIRTDSCPDEVDPAPGEDSAPAADALAEGVSAMKAVLRERPTAAVALLDRAFERVDVDDTATGRWREDITRLAAAATKADPAARALADQVVALAGEYLY